MKKNSNNKNKNTDMLCGFHVTGALPFSVPYGGDYLQILRVAPDILIKSRGQPERGGPPS
jgi:hypothetical protein